MREGCAVGDAHQNAARHRIAVDGHDELGERRAVGAGHLLGPGHVGQGLLVKGDGSALDFSISGQHYLFDVQSFAHTILAAGGDSYSYALRDRTTQGVIDDVASGTSELGARWVTKRSPMTDRSRLSADT